MSRSVGTLVTTHNATYIPPRFMPGYRGHCPTIKFDYGETYGSATSKHFQDYRSEVLNSSMTPYAKGGSYPGYNTHSADLVISDRKRTQDRWLSIPKYELSNIDRDRKEEQFKFNQLTQSHREYYSDKTGTMKAVGHFMLPVSAQDQYRMNINFILMTEKHTGRISLPPLDHVASRAPLIKRFNPNSTVRDREMRDVHFEKR